MFFDVFDIFESKWGSDDSGGDSTTLTASLRFAGTTSGTDELSAEVWGQYGFSSRPGKPDGTNRCQAIVGDLAGRRAVLFTRDTRGPKAHGDLNDGDVAVWSVGKNSIRCNADGSIAILQMGASSDAFFIIEKDGSQIQGNQWGQIELGPDGFKVILASGEAFALGNGAAQFIAPKIGLMGGAVLLGAGAAVPLAAVPITGTVGAGFVSAKPVANIFV